MEDGAFRSLRAAEGADFEEVNYQLVYILICLDPICIPSQGVTAASSGTRRRLTWRSLARPSAGQRSYRRGAAEILAGSP